MFKKALSLTLIALLFFSGTGFAFAKTTTKIYYFLPDHLGGVDKVLDENGNIVQDKDYGAFGGDRVPSLSNPVTDYGFTGKEKDTETGLYNYGARQLDPVTGRFTTMDPVTLGEGGKPFESILENPQALNPYSYALNNPLRYIDQTGQYEEEVHYTLTYYLMLSAGFSQADASKIAWYDFRMDSDPDTAPVNANNVISGVTQKYHFADPQTAINNINQAIESQDTQAFGKALHTYQDVTGAHKGLTPSTHAPLTILQRAANFVKMNFIKTDPDKTQNDPDKAYKVFRRTFFLGRQFRMKTSNIEDQKEVSNFREESKSIWNSISSHVKQYIEAEDKSTTSIKKDIMEKNSN